MIPHVFWKQLCTETCCIETSMHIHFMVRIKQARGACDLPRVMERWCGISWKSKVAPCHGSLLLPAYYVTLLCASVSHKQSQERNR